ncbi:MAG: hypothetical protein J1E83_12325 [Lachnospiraceae bacterium]|nr:hypothetical protein [Lachnospiraceae bacterium]
MFEQDYIMRLIKEIIRTILKLLFNIDTETPTTRLIENEEKKATLETLLNMVDDGSINEAENKIFEIAATEDKVNLEMILLFYSYLNDKSEDFLMKNNFSRKELQDDLKCILSQYGLDSMVEVFLS